MVSVATFNPGHAFSLFFFRVVLHIPAAFLSMKFPSPLRLVVLALVVFPLTRLHASADSVIVVNEIHYHPANELTQSEWIEFHNLHGVDVDISGWKIRGGVDYDFAIGTIVPGHGYLLVASNPGDPALTGLGAFGPFTGKLDNGGETFRLENIDGRVMDEVSYGDGGSWPNGPDGSGATLAKIVEESADSEPGNWTTSALVGGTPKAQNFPAPPAAPSLVFNEIAGAGTAPFRIEIANVGTSAANLLGHTLSRGSGDSYILPAQALSPGDFFVIDDAALGFTPVNGDTLFLFNASGSQLLDSRKVTNRLRGLSLSEWAYPSAPTFGAANSFAFQQDVVINEILYNAPGIPGTPAVPGTYATTTFLPYDANWRFDESGVSLPSGWAAMVHPVGGTWFSGPGIHAFETGTSIPIGTTLVSPFLKNPRVITYYFETEFTLTAPQLAATEEFFLEHYIDDGAIFYLNGVEIERYEMPADPIVSSTLATRGYDAVIVGPVIIPRNFFVVGANRLSVEVHQNTSGSSDIVMGAKISGRTVVTPPVPALPYRSNPEQWVELYNRGASPVSLGGWSFSDGIGFTFPAGMSLSPGGYVVVASDLASFMAKYPAVTVAGVFSGSLSRSGERLRLRDAAGNIADELNYFDGGRWPELADAGGASLELRDPRADNNLPESWAPSDLSNRGAWQTFTYRGKPVNGEADPTFYNEFVCGLHDDGTVLLDDISVIEDPDGTARQLIQNGNFSGNNTDKWRFLGTHKYADVIDDPDSPGNKVLRIRATGATEHMSNHAETTFRNGTTYVVTDASKDYQISFRARSMGGSPLLNTRLYFNRLARTHVLVISDLYGTPGAANSSAVPNIGPTYTGLTHAPAVPAVNQAATVTVIPTDPDGVAGLTLFYAINGAAFTSTPMSALGDGTGRWSGSIPGQALNAKVQFYVRATDTPGAVSFFPTAGPDSRALIPWQDNQAILDYGGGKRANNFRIVMTTADTDILHLVTDMMSNDRLGGTLIYNESEIYYDTAVRLRGSEHTRVPTAQGDARTGFDVNFGSDRPFLGAHKSVAIDRSGGVVYSQREMIIKHAIARVGGIPGVQADLIRVIAPRTIHTGSAIMGKSQFDGPWFDNSYASGSDGGFFKYEIIYPLSTTQGGGPEGLKLTQAVGNVGRVKVKDLGDDKEAYRWHYLNRNREEADDYAGMMAAAKAIGLSAGATFHEQTKALLDVDQWLRSFAIQNLFGVVDGYAVGGEHNAFFYQRPSDGKMLLFPWDLDYWGGSSGSTATPGDLGKLVTDPANERAYWGHMQDLINTVFNNSYLDPWISHYDAFLPAENLDFVKTRISSTIAPTTTAITNAVANVAYSITTPNGQSTGNPFLTIEGRGWVNVREIRLAGSGTPLALTWITDNTWQAQLPVLPGANSATLVAYNFQGVQIGSSTLAYTGTNLIVPASAANLVISEMMYHPADPSVEEMNAGFTDADDFEYLELTNISTSPVTLSGVQFTNGIAYAFPATVLQPGAHGLVVAKQTAFTARYGSGLPVIGEYPAGGKLNNGGERLVLSDSIGGIIRDFTYDDALPWPLAADGDGYSLVLVAPATNPDHALAANWRASALPGGNPGTSDATTFVGDPNADSDGDGLSAFLEHALGGSDSFAGVSGVTISVGPDGFARFSYPRSLSADDVLYFPEISGDLVTWNAADSTFVLESDSPSGTGTSTVTMRATDANPDQRFCRLRVKSRP